MSLKLSLSVLGPAAVGLAIALLLVSRTIYRRKFITPNLPPGPRGLPIIGVQFYLSTVNSSATDIYLHYFLRMYLTCRASNSGSRTLNGAVNTVSIQIYIFNNIFAQTFPLHLRRGYMFRHTPGTTIGYYQLFSSNGRPGSKGHNILGPPQT